MCWMIAYYETGPDAAAHPLPEESEGLFFAPAECSGRRVFQVSPEQGALCCCFFFHIPGESLHGTEEEDRRDVEEAGRLQTRLCAFVAGRLALGRVEPHLFISWGEGFEEFDPGASATPVRLENLASVFAQHMPDGLYRIDP